MKGVLIASLLGACAVTAAAQTVDDAIRLTQTMIETERQELVAANMALTESERAVFWQLYAEYRQAMAPVAAARAELLKRFAENLGALRDDEAMALLDESFAVEQDQLEVRRRFARKMGRSLPGRTVARFFQIENRLDGVLERELAAEVPLVE